MKNPVALAPAPSISPTTGLSETFPAILRRAGTHACFAADEFFSARLSNSHTRRAYARPVGRFLAWCEEQGIELRQVTPGLAGRFIEELPGSDPTRNLALAALRHFFDALVMRHAVALNPFASVRGRKHSVIDGQTPELTIQQARDLLASLDTSHVLGLRDRAVLGTLIYTGARVGAIAQLRLQDLRDQGEHRVMRFSEKGVSSGRFQCVMTWTAGFAPTLTRRGSPTIPRTRRCFEDHGKTSGGSSDNPSPLMPFAVCSSGGSTTPDCLRSSAPTRFALWWSPIY